MGLFVGRPRRRQRQQHAGALGAAVVEAGQLLNGGVGAGAVVGLECRGLGEGQEQAQLVVDAAPLGLAEGGGVFAHRAGFFDDDGGVTLSEGHGGVGVGLGAGSEDGSVGAGQAIFDEGLQRDSVAAADGGRVGAERLAFVEQAQGSPGDAGLFGQQAGSDDAALWRRCGRQGRQSLTAGGGVARRECFGHGFDGGLGEGRARPLHDDGGGDGSDDDDADNDGGHAQATSTTLPGQDGIVVVEVEAVVGHRRRLGRQGQRALGTRTGVRGHRRWRGHRLGLGLRRRRRLLGLHLVKGIGLKGARGRGRQMHLRHHRRRHLALGGVGGLDHLKETRQLGDLTELFPAATRARDLVVTDHFALDDPLLQRRQLAKTKDLAVGLLDHPVAHRRLGRVRRWRAHDGSLLATATRCGAVVCDRRAAVCGRRAHGARGVGGVAALHDLEDMTATAALDGGAGGADPGVVKLVLGPTLAATNVHGARVSGSALTGIVRRRWQRNVWILPTWPFRHAESSRTDEGVHGPH